MTSRLLSAIDARIRKARDPVENACLRAEKAALLARQGQLDAARTELRDLRARFDSRPHAAVSAWASLAEGLVAYFEDLNASARDKFLRALALSDAVRSDDLRALCAAWLAHIEYVEQDFDGMARHLTIARAEFGIRSNAVRSRASLVTAQAFHAADRLDLALPWYARVREYASQDGDEATLSALMHNMMWLRATHARRIALDGMNPSGDLGQVLLGAESTGNLDLLIGTASLTSLVPMLRAHVLVLLERYVEALTLFDEFLQSSIAQGLSRIECAVLAEIAWCRVNTGDQTRALVDAKAIEFEIGRCVFPDERAAANGRLAQIFEMLGDDESARRHRRLAEVDWRVHTANQERLIALLAAIDNGELESQSV